MITHIKLQGDGKWLTDWLGGEFKPYSVPLINSKDITPIILKDTEKYKFELPIPKTINNALDI